MATSGQAELDEMTSTMSVEYGGKIHVRIIFTAILQYDVDFDAVQSQSQFGLPVLAELFLVSPHDQEYEQQITCIPAKNHCLSTSFGGSMLEGSSAVTLLPHTV